MEGGGISNMRIHDACVALLPGAWVAPARRPEVGEMKNNSNGLKNHRHLRFWQMIYPRVRVFLGGGGNLMTEVVPQRDPSLWGPGSSEAGARVPVCRRAAESSSRSRWPSMTCDGAQR